MDDIGTDKPPKYDGEAPPSYDSLFGQIKHVKQTTGGDKKALAVGVCAVLTGSVLYLIVLCILLAIPISAIAIGAKYLHDCPAQRYIPIYLIVFGVFAVIQNLSSIFQTCKKRKDRQNGGEEPDATQQAKPNPFDGIIGCFLFAWFIAGNVWVYGLQGEWVSSPVTAANYCDPTLYYYSFWLITGSYILCGVCCCGVIILGICLMCCAACCAD